MVPLPGYRPNPVDDILAFLTEPQWPNAVFDALLLASILFALRCMSRQKPYAGLHDGGIWLLRVVIGSMWWQQSAWKIPPDYDGLLHTMGDMADHAAIPALGDWVRDTAVPGIDVFGPAIYGAEVAIAVSLMLGLFSRLGAFLGLCLAVLLLLGLYSAPGQWPWTWMFLAVIQANWVIRPPGRSLGVDALLTARGG